MPRQARRDAPGVHHHVVLRGLNRAAIFEDARDRGDLVARLDRILPESGTTCLAWALMPNHFHLVVRTGPVPLATVVARAATGYAKYFNRRHARCGYLFQNRYWSEPVRDDAHLSTLVVYVHRNPVKAGLVSLRALGRHPWTGHAALLGATARPFHDARSALALFGDGPDAPRVLREQMLRAADPAHGAPRGEPGLARLLAAVAQGEGVAPGEILGGSRRPRVCAARRRMVVVACRELGLSQVRVAEFLGVSPAAVSQAYRRAGTGDGRK